MSAKEVHSHTRYAYKRFRFAAGYVVVLKELYTKLGLLKSSGNFALHRTDDVMTVECDFTQRLVYWPGGFFCVCECPLPPFLQNHWPPTPLPALPKTNCRKVTQLDANKLQDKKNNIKKKNIKRDGSDGRIITSFAGFMFSACYAKGH